MRRLITMLVCVWLLGVTQAQAAGTLSCVPATDEGPGFPGATSFVTCTWTSTAGGAVSGNAFAPPTGILLQAEIVPGSGGSQPSADYDLTVVNARSVDVLDGEGANLSNSLGKFITNPGGGVWLGRTATLDIVIANAGNAKTGTVYLWIRP